jgi:hypothetical protein
MASEVRATLVRHIYLAGWIARLTIDSRYEKDWMRPVNPNKVPKLDETKLAHYPPGYRYGSVLSTTLTIAYED